MEGLCENQPELFDIRTAPAPTNPECRAVWEKKIKGENLTLKEKINYAGRDNICRTIGDYECKPDCCYRAITLEGLQSYQKNGYINSQMFSGADWYLGGFCARYGSIVLECPADKRFFKFAGDNGVGLAKDPLVRFMHSPNDHPVPMSMVTNIFDLQKIQEQQATTAQNSSQTIVTPELNDVDKYYLAVDKLKTQIVDGSIATSDLRWIAESSNELSEFSHKIFLERKTEYQKTQHQDTEIQLD